MELETYYIDELKKEPRAIFHKFKDTRQYFKENFKLDRKEFDEYINKLHDDWTKTGMRFYGGIASQFTPNNIIIDNQGNHYILWGYSGSIRPELLQYSSVMFG